MDRMNMQHKVSRCHADGLPGLAARTLNHVLIRIEWHLTLAVPASCGEVFNQIMHLCKHMNDDRDLHSYLVWLKCF